MSNTLIETRNLSKCFNEGELLVEVLKGIDFTIKSNQSIAIIGTSGSGKSTLLHLLGGLDMPDKGEVFINNKNNVAITLCFGTPKPHLCSLDSFVCFDMPL